MQPLIAPPRGHLTEAQVRALLTGDAVTVTQGLELLDTSNRVVEDLSEDMESGGEVTWDNRDAVHARLRCAIQRELVWGRDRVRPYVTLSDRPLDHDPTVAARFNLGVYVPTTPDTVRGEDPATWEVTGYDLLSLLQSTGPGDTWIATAGTTYFAAMQAVMTESGIGVPLRLDGTRQDTTLPATRVWALTSQAVSWLRILTDLCTEIGYVAPWMDPDGAIRSHPYQLLEERPVEWTLNVADPATNLAHADRTLTIEGGELANWWRGYRTDMDSTPVEGDGIYTTENQNLGPTSQVELGRIIRRVIPLQAADQAALVAQVEKIRAGDMAAARRIDLRIDPLPIMWANDVFWYVDDGTAEKVEAAQWTLNLDGAAGTLQLGGRPAEPLEQTEAQAKATVTSVAPLRVVVDGATVASFANALGGSYSIGQRVSVTIRNPLPPLVQGVES